MSIALYTLTSSLHSETIRNAKDEPFINNIEEALGEEFECHDNDYSSYGSHDTEIIYVRTGGTEGLFKSLGINGYVRLLTSGDSNSLAASMEILSYLRQKGRHGEILHGSPDYIAGRIRHNVSVNGEDFDTARVSCENIVLYFDAIDLGGIRLGVIGEPSDWLISSGVDYVKAKERLNAELVDIPMKELLDRLPSSGIDMRSFKGSEVIYDALSGIVRDFNLQGLSLRCFDLLDSVHNTGCLALARLNAEGIVSSCEGDIPALLSMAYLQKTKGCPGFQCNLSRVDGDRFLFAHCTIPLNMVSSYRYATHFESGIGTAIKGELTPGEVETFKISPDLEHCVRIPGRIVENTSRPNLCRTQVIVEAPGAAAYFLHNPLANHHIISYK